MKLTRSGGNAVAVAVAESDADIESIPCAIWEYYYNLTD